MPRPTLTNDDDDDDSRGHVFLDVFESISFLQ